MTYNYFLNIKCYPSNCSRIVKKIEPIDGLINKDNNKNWLITGNSFVFDLQLPVDYSQAQVIINAPTSDSNRDILTGFKLNSEYYNYLSHYYNKKLFSIIEQTWQKIENDDFIIYARNTNSINSIEDFFLKSPDNSEVAQLNYNLKKTHLTDNTYQAKNDQLIIEENLKGSHEIVTYIKDENLNIKLNYFSLDDQDNTPVTVSIEKWGSDQQIYSQSSEITKGQIDINLSNLEENSYLISINASENTIFTKILTTQHRFVFNGFLKFGKRDHKTDFYTNGSFIQDEKKNTLIKDLTNITKWEADTNNQFFHTEGWFALSQNNFFTPPNLDGASAANFNDLDNLKSINYLIIKKPLPILKTKDSDTISSNIFDIRDIEKTDQGIVSFIVSSNKKNMQINNINIKFIK